MTGQHGGRRVGAGRPPLEGGRTFAVSITLTQQTIDKVEAWQRDHGCANFSEALRQMIDKAEPTTTQQNLEGM